VRRGLQIRTSGINLLTHRWRTSDLLAFRQDAEVNQALAPLLRSQLVTTDRAFCSSFDCKSATAEFWRAKSLRTQRLITRAGADL